METILYQNKWCKIVETIDNIFILKSLSNKYNDQYFGNITEVFKSVGIPEGNIQNKIKEYNESVKDEK